MIDLDSLFGRKQQPDPVLDPQTLREMQEYQDMPSGVPVHTPQPTPSAALHIHQWTEKLRSVAPRRRELPDFQSPPDAEVLEKALLGVLTVIYECVICKELYKTELLGSDKTELDDILDNVEKTGGQYYQRNGITFVIQRHQPAQPTVTLR